MNLSDLKSAIPGLDGELKKQTALWLARLILNALGWLLTGIGAFTSDQYAAWLDANVMAFAGVLMAIVGAVWSYVHTRRNVATLGAAISLDPQKPTGGPTSVADVKRALKG